MPAQLSGAGLRKHCENEINRLGLVPALEGGVSAPGTNAANAGLGFQNSPHMLPALEPTMKALVAAILGSSPAPLPRPLDSGVGEHLPAQVATEPESAPAAAAEAHSPIAAEEIA